MMMMYRFVTIRFGYRQEREPKQTLREPTSRQADWP